MAVEAAGLRVVVAADLDTRDIAQANDGAVRRRAQDDRAELVRRLQTRLGVDGRVELLIGAQPAATWTFWASTAARMSEGMSLKLFSL